MHTLKFVYTKIKFSFPFLLQRKQRNLLFLFLIFFFLSHPSTLPPRPQKVTHTHKLTHSLSLSLSLSLSQSFKCHFLTYTSHKRNNHSLHTLSFLLSLSFSLSLSISNLCNYSLKLIKPPSEKKTQKSHLKIQNPYDPDNHKSIPPTSSSF